MDERRCWQGMNHSVYTRFEQARTGTLRPALFFVSHQFDRLTSVKCYSIVPREALRHADTRTVANPLNMQEIVTT